LTQSRNFKNNQGLTQSRCPTGTVVEAITGRLRHGAGDKTYAIMLLVRSLVEVWQIALSGVKASTADQAMYQAGQCEPRPLLPSFCSSRLTGLGLNIHGSGSWWPSNKKDRQTCGRRQAERDGRARPVARHRWICRPCPSQALKNVPRSQAFFRTPGSSWRPPQRVGRGVMPVQDMRNGLAVRSSAPCTRV
jgi:hypothetical protein